MFFNWILLVLSSYFSEIPLRRWNYIDSPLENDVYGHTHPRTHLKSSAFWSTSIRVTWSNDILGVIIGILSLQVNMHFWHGLCRESAFNKRRNCNDRQRCLGKYFGIKWCLRLGVGGPHVHDLAEGSRDPPGEKLGWEESCLGVTAKVTMWFAGTLKSVLTQWPTLLRAGSTIDYDTNEIGKVLYMQSTLYQCFLIWGLLVL